ncbi:hypothetical protein C8J56DRAFT_587143 [Mycena floridula]|nr:hypothetical protein C8J56DRAFT_587143 [Mycena floridula]
MTLFRLRRLAFATFAARPSAILATSTRPGSADAKALLPGLPFHSDSRLVMSTRACQQGDDMIVEAKYDTRLRRRFWVLKCIYSSSDMLK